MLCVDKTGTLTQNLMTLTEFSHGQGFIKLSEQQGTDFDQLQLLILTALRASALKAVDPMDRAIHLQAQMLDLVLTRAGKDLSSSSRPLSLYSTMEIIFWCCICR